MLAPILSCEPSEATHEGLSRINSAPLRALQTVLALNGLKLRFSAVPSRDLNTKLPVRTKDPVELAERRVIYWG